MTEDNKTRSPTPAYCRACEAIYKEKWEAKLAKDSEVNLVAINIVNGDAVLGDTSEEAIRRAQEQYPRDIPFMRGWASKRV